MEAKLYGQNKGGMSINGIIKDYYAYAGENISAGDLVEYVNGIAGKTDYGESVDTQLSTTSYTGYTISAVKLDENRVFIAHSVDSNYQLSGIVVSIDGTSITYGTDTKISTNGYTGHTISTCLLPNGNVFIAGSWASSYQLYGWVISIDGTTITSHGYKGFNTNANAGYSISTCLLPNGNVFIAHSAGSNYQLYGIVVSIDGTTMTAGSDTALVSSSNAGQAISTCLLPNGNVFIAHSYGSNYYLYGMVCSISGTTITKGGDTALDNTNANSGYAISALTLRDNKVFIAHHYSKGQPRGTIVTINGTNISVNMVTQLASIPTSSQTHSVVSACLMRDGNVFVTFNTAKSGTSDCLYGMICVITDTEIKARGAYLYDTAYSGYFVSSLLLDNGAIFVAHSDSSNYRLNAQIFSSAKSSFSGYYEPTNQISIIDYETQVRKVTTGLFDGVAKTSGEGGDDTGHKDLVSIWTKE